MEVCAGSGYKTLLLVATSKEEADKLRNIVIQLGNETRFKQLRNLVPVIPERLYLAQSVEESLF